MMSNKIRQNKTAIQVSTCAHRLTRLLVSKGSTAKSQNRTFLSMWFLLGPSTVLVSWTSTGCGTGAGAA